MDDKKIYISTINDGNTRDTYTTASLNSIKLMQLSDIQIQALKDKIGEFCNSFADTIIADEMELEFSFGITVNGDICILSGNSSMGIKVKLKWNR